MAGLVERMIGAACLQVHTYEEVEADTQATGQAMAVVIISSLCAGIGLLGTFGIGGLIKGTVVALIGWVIWAFLTYIIGTRILPEPQTKADVGELLRTTGFASAPGVVRVLTVVPVLGVLVGIVTFVWMLAAMVVAVRQALDYSSTGRAIGVCLISWVVYVIVSMVLGVLAGLGRAF